MPPPLLPISPLPISPLRPNPPRSTTEEDEDFDFYRSIMAGQGARLSRREGRLNTVESGSTAIGERRIISSNNRIGSISSGVGRSTSTNSLEPAIGLEREEFESVEETRLARLGLNESNWLERERGDEVHMRDMRRFRQIRRDLSNQSTNLNLNNSMQKKKDVMNLYCGNSLGLTKKSANKSEEREILPQGFKYSEEEEITGGCGILICSRGSEESFLRKFPTLITTTESTVFNFASDEPPLIELVGDLNLEKVTEKLNSTICQGCERVVIGCKGCGNGLGYRITKACKPCEITGMNWFFCRSSCNFLLRKAEASPLRRYVPEGITSKKRVRVQEVEKGAMKWETIPSRTEDLQSGLIGFNDDWGMEKMEVKRAVVEEIMEVDEDWSILYPPMTTASSRTYQNFSLSNGSRSTLNPTAVEFNPDRPLRRSGAIRVSDVARGPPFPTNTREANRLRAEPPTSNSNSSSLTDVLRDGRITVSDSRNDFSNLERGEAEPESLFSAPRVYGAHIRRSLYGSPTSSFEEDIEGGRNLRRRLNLSWSRDGMESEGTVSAESMRVEERIRAIESLLDREEEDLLDF